MYDNSVGDGDDDDDEMIVLRRMILRMMMLRMMWGRTMPKTGGPHFVRACAVEMHLDISQEPLQAPAFFL